MKDYSQRSVVDKLGIKPGDVVAFDEMAGAIDADLRSDVLERASRAPATPGEIANIVLIAADASTDVAVALRRWKTQLQPNGGVWLLTPKRGRPGYVNQSDVIAAGLPSGLVDNKSCSVSAAVSGLRFVTRRADREPRPASSPSSAARA